jgi:hypothetical protein
MRDVVIALVKSGFVSECSSPLTTIPPGASGAAFPHTRRAKRSMRRLAKARPWPAQHSPPLTNVSMTQIQGSRVELLFSADSLTGKSGERALIAMRDVLSALREAPGRTFARLAIHSKRQTPRTRSSTGTLSTPCAGTNGHGALEVLSLASGSASRLAA